MKPDDLFGPGEMRWASMAGWHAALGEVDQARAAYEAAVDAHWSLPEDWVRGLRELLPPYVTLDEAVGGGGFFYVHVQLPGGGHCLEQPRASDALVTPAVYLFRLLLRVATIEESCSS